MPSTPAPVARLSRLVFLWRTLVAQELAARYRGTFLGMAWQLLSPLFLLAVYGFVFGVVFKARWPGSEAATPMVVALNLFLGLVLHGVLAETLSQAPSLLQRNANFVRKVVFPLPVLVAVPLGVALVNLCAGLLIVGGLSFATQAAGAPSLAQLWQVLPVLLAFSALVLGLGLAFAALGVYVRDLAQVVGMLVMALLFTSPVLYPREMAPGVFRELMVVNPLTVPLEHLRGVLLTGAGSDWAVLGLYALVAMAVLGCSVTLFQLLRRGFADLL